MIMNKTCKIHGRCLVHLLPHMHNTHNAYQCQVPQAVGGAIDWTTSKPCPILSPQLGPWDWGGEIPVKHGLLNFLLVKSWEGGGSDGPKKSKGAVMLGAS